MIALSNTLSSFGKFVGLNSVLFISRKSQKLLNRPGRQVLKKHLKHLILGIRRMITRAKLVEQLREYQIRSQHKCSALTIFSPKPRIVSWSDVTVAVLFAILFSILVVSSYVTLYFRHFWLSFFIICLGIFLPIRLRRSRQALTRKRERRMLLPLSM